MKFQVAVVEKYGEEVWQHVEMDKLRATQCLCLNCKLLGECAVAQAFYVLCVKNNVALAVTRCPTFVQKEEH